MSGPEPASTPGYARRFDELRNRAEEADTTVHMRPMTETESNLMTQVLTLRRQVGGIRRLHQQYRPAFGDSDVCAHCTRGMDLVYWPCPTIEALDKLTSIIGVE